MKFLTHLCLVFLCLCVGSVKLWAENAAPLQPLPIPQSFGVNIHFRSDAELPAQINLIKQAGFGWVRFDLNWQRVEAKAGVYDFSAYDPLVAALGEAKIRMVAILDYNNTNYDDGLSPASDTGRKAFAQFAVAAARNFAGKNIVWEIYNEPNHTFWKPQPNAGDYVQLANVATEALRQANPSELVVGPALSGPAFYAQYSTLKPEAKAFFEAVLRSPAAQAWNGITIHPYRAHADNPETLFSNLSTIRGMMQQVGLDQTAHPLILSEFGYSTATGNTDEAQEAAFAVRGLLIGAIEQMPFVIWYNWQEVGENPADYEDKFGLIRYGSVANKALVQIAKPAFFAVRELTENLGGYRFDKIVEDQPAYIITHFIKDKSEAYAMWSKDKQSHQARIYLAAGSWIVAKILSAKGVLTVNQEQETAFTLTAMPTLLRFEHP